MRQLLLLETSLISSRTSSEMGDPIFYAFKTLLHSVVSSLFSRDSHSYAFLVPFCFQSQFQEALKTYVIHLEPSEIYKLHSIRAWYITSNAEWMAWLSSYVLYPHAAYFYFLFPSLHVLNGHTKEGHDEQGKQWLRALSLLQSLPNWIILEFSDANNNQESIELTKKYVDNIEWMDIPTNAKD